MTKIELVYICNSYCGGEEEFCEIIDEFLKLDENNIDWLRTRIGSVSQQVIIYWGKGYYFPTAKVRCEIVGIVKEKLTEKNHLFLTK